MVEQCQSIARNKLQVNQKNRRQSTKRFFKFEIDRLESLARINPNVPDVEINALKHEAQEIDTAIAAARLRLDAIRLIVQS